ncbi:low molecular weight protein-tyrosine-phosphatase [Rhodovibrio sodomensis]|uniref:low molecular weight protein-tyrosine-phosphatase n=1 Tax=Rhodovibrio sodomensis TaxID=1088 RepID=UPI00308435CF
MAAPQESTSNPRAGTPVSVLFVCTGNICRSPSAEAILRHKAHHAGLADRLKIDSAGLGEWHLGHPPDPRAVDAVAAHGYSMGGQTARLVDPRDFERFDYVIAMDEGHHAQLNEICPRARKDRVRLFLEFAPQTGRKSVPDPYYGDTSGFDAMVGLIEAGTDGILAEIAERAG